LKVLILRASMPWLVCCLRFVPIAIGIAVATARINFFCF
jgi:hypothetical protein